MVRITVIIYINDGDNDTTLVIIHNFSENSIEDI